MFEEMAHPKRPFTPKPTTTFRCFERSFKNRTDRHFFTFFIWQKQKNRLKLFPKAPRKKSPIREGSPPCFPATCADASSASAPFTFTSLNALRNGAPKMKNYPQTKGDRNPWNRTSNSHVSVFPQPPFSPSPLRTVNRETRTKRNKCTGQRTYAVPPTLLPTWKGCIYRFAICSNPQVHPGSNRYSYRD